MIYNQLMIKWKELLNNLKVNQGDHLNLNGGPIFLYIMQLTKVFI